MQAFHKVMMGVCGTVTALGITELQTLLVAYKIEFLGSIFELCLKMATRNIWN